MVLAAMTVFGSAQAPQAFQYQAVIRDAAGNLLENQAVGIKLSLLQGSVTSPAVYVETHMVTTNLQGLVSLKVGRGTVVSGSFSNLKWGTYHYYLRIAVDITGGTSYQVIGNTELLSVPYALYAADGNPGPQGPQGPAGPSGVGLTNRGLWVAGVYQPGNFVSSRSSSSESTNSIWFLKGTVAYSSAVQPFEDLSHWTELAGAPGSPGASSWIDGPERVTTSNKVGIGTNNPSGMLAVQADANIPSDTALFQVKDQQGRTVFAVYNNGALLIVDDEVKGGRGGFVVGGRTTSKAEGVEDIMLITPDSVRIYIEDPAAAKGGRGGFAVGGRVPSKGVDYDYLYISPDSARVYINDDPLKGGRGGFAVSGRTPAKGSSGDDYLHVMPDSTRV